MGVREVVAGDQEPCPVAQEVEVLLCHVELREARLAEAAEKVDDEQRGQRRGVDVGR